MPFATARTISLAGSVGHLVDVQVDVSSGMVGTTLVGRPDAAVSEGRDRCRMAVQNTTSAWPSTRRVTILLSPADVPKSGSHFDLAMAVAVLAAAEQLPVGCLDGSVFVGELTLDGRLRPVQGVLPMVLAASARGIGRVFVPEPQAPEATLVPGMTVYGVRSLAQVIAVLTGELPPEAPPVEAESGRDLLTWRGQARLDEVDLADVAGMADPRYAVEVAAAGGHHLLLSGPRGAGKTTLAERLPGLLPDLDLEESLELTALHSLAGTLRSGQERLVRPPFCAPHSSSSRASLLGGGSGRVRPGEISRAHGGVLFLDEFPLFSADLVEALRQPLESGEITIARGEMTATYPARCMVVLAANPCPCGDYTPSPVTSRCVCPETRRRDYRRKLTGPVVDRIDITRHVEPVAAYELADPVAGPPDSTAVVRARVTAARGLQRERYAGEGWRTNAQVPGPVLTERFPLTDAATRRLGVELHAGRVTRRGVTRVHRLAWTVADLRGLDRPGPDEVDVALRLRCGDPLPAEAVRPARRAG